MTVVGCPESVGSRQGGGAGPLWSVGSPLMPGSPSTVAARCSLLGAGSTPAWRVPEGSVVGGRGREPGFVSLCFFQKHSE